jgi:hypothetical protein
LTNSAPSNDFSSKETCDAEGWSDKRLNWQRWNPFKDRNKKGKNSLT